MKYLDIDTYIAGFRIETQQILEEIRSAIAQAAPIAKETINYSIPTFRLNGNLVHFAAYQKHIGFYPSPSGIKAFASELKGYKTSKGAIQFPLDEPMPLDLIRRITAFRVEENLASQ